MLEEAHEVAAAIDGGSAQDLAAELGDLLFQIVFIARVEEERGEFDLTTVIERIREKMIDRHPHVFGEERQPDSAAVRGAWEKRKVAGRGRSVLEGVPPSLPSLLAAYRMTQKAAGVGFDWPDLESIVDKIEEELSELRAVLVAPQQDSTRPAAREEVGDLLFTIANLARRLDIDPDAALIAANRKFERRFRALEDRLKLRGRSVVGSTLDELNEL